MRFLSRTTHGILDYIIAIALIAAPYLFGFMDADPAAYWTAWIVGVGVFLLALLSNHDASLIEAIPMRTHLWVDYVAGLLLAASPWLFGFADDVWVPHLLVGALIFLSALFTEPGVEGEPGLGM